MSMSMLLLSVFLDGCHWLYYTVLLNDVDIGIVHCDYLCLLALLVAMCTAGC